MKSAYKELIIVAILLGIILGIGEVLYKLKLKPIQHDITTRDSISFEVQSHLWLDDALITWRVDTVPVDKIDSMIIAHQIELEHIKYTIESLRR